MKDATTERPKTLSETPSTPTSTRHTEKEAQAMSTGPIKNDCPKPKESERIIRIKINDEAEQFLNDVIATKMKIQKQLEGVTDIVDESLATMDWRIDEQRTLFAIISSKLRSCFDMLRQCRELNKPKNILYAADFIKDLDEKLLKVETQLKEANRGFGDLHGNFVNLLRKSEDLEALFMSKITELDASREIKEIFSAPRDSVESDALFWRVPQNRDNH